MCLCILLLISLFHKKLLFADRARIKDSPHFFFEDRKAEIELVGSQCERCHTRIPELRGDEMASLKEDLGDGLLATDIFGTDDGQSVAGWNSNEAACALFNQITNYMVDALTGSGFPALGRYYILDLVDDKMVIVITMGDFQWGLFLDTAKVKLGLLLNVVIPKIVDSFEQAIAE